jgi:hypothetical protein
MSMVSAPKAHSTRYVTAVPLTAVRNSFLNASADLGLWVRWSSEENYMGKSYGDQNDHLDVYYVLL